jgi:hypothetical protein
VNFGKQKAVLFVALFAVLVSLSIGTASAAKHYVQPGESIRAAILPTSGAITKVRMQTVTGLGYLLCHRF